MKVLLMLVAALTLGVDAGYYKPRPHYYPSAKLHHGPKPISHYYKQQPVPFHRRPSPFHAPRNPIRPPPRPYFNKPTPPTPPPFPPATWKTRFSAPVVKETFHPAPVPYSSQNYLDDKGPIHTIPAPNLSPADRPAHAQLSSDTEPVYKHRHVDQPKPSQSYQVTEDPSAYKPYSAAPSYYAPDPDPSLPTPEVPQTLDPQSQPSNGQVPLDLYEQQQQTYTDASGNTLSSQDLYNLLHGLGQNQQSQQMTAALYQQYLQAAAAQQPATYQQVYNSALLYPQQYQQQLTPQFSQQNFHPQYETFNYNEQTQESAHGSDSFPSASSLSVGVKRAVSKDTGVSGGESRNSINTDYKKDQEEDSSEVGVISNQVDYDDERSTESEGLVPYYATLPNKQTAEALATLAAAGSINNQLMKTPHQGDESEQDIKLHYTTNEVKIQDDDNRQNVIRGNTNIQINQNNNENHGNNDHRQQPHRNQEVRVHENRQSQQKQHTNYEHKASSELYINHNMAGQINMNSHVQNQHTYSYTRDQQTKDKTPQKESNENDENITESDYTEDEILDPSDKDQRTNSVRVQNGMKMYGVNYLKNTHEKDEENFKEEQNYDDNGNDYTQEEDKEISKAKSSTTVEKSVDYNSRQNNLPFGAKLRPKRV